MELTDQEAVALTQGNRRVMSEDLSPVVQDTAEETHFSPAAPRGLRWDFPEDWEEGGDWEGDR